MIAGVVIKPLKLMPDDRGFLMEILREDDPMFERFGQVYITGCKEGVAKGWHYHKQQTDHFVCVGGKALVVLYDQRRDSSTHGKVDEFVLEGPPCRDHEPLLIKIPPEVVHGFTAIECPETIIVNIPTLPYRYEDPDEYRYPWNGEDVPYKWPASVVTGG